jgi:hypothetical protein
VSKKVSLIKKLLRAIKSISFIFILLLGWSWTQLNGQTPSTQPSTQPSKILGDTLQLPIDTIDQNFGDLDPTPLDTARTDSIRLDTSQVDRTRIGTKPPPRKIQKRAPAPILTDEVYYFYHDKQNEIFEFNDTTIHSLFFQYDPARNERFDYASLGNMGTPLQSLQYRWEDRSGTRFGLDEVYRPYIRDESELRFYTKSKAFSDVFYSQGVEQNDHIFRGDFGRSFDNGIKFSISHDRLIHSLTNSDINLNTNAFYSTSETKNTSLLTGLAFQKEGSKYQAFAIYAHNEINQLFNGGILTNDPAITTAIIDSNLANANDFDNGISIPTNIANRSNNLRYRFRTLAYDQYLTLSGTVDSLSKSSRIFNINHKIKYVDDVYRFYETNFNDTYYQDLATDDRGLRVALNQKVVENYFGLSTLKTKNGEIIPSLLGDISLGLRHQFVNVDGEVYEKNFNNLFAEGSWKVSPFKALTLDVFGQLGILDNIGDFRINATATLSLDKWGTLEGRLRQQRYSPSVYEERNFVTQIEVWNTNFDKPFNSELGFTYRLPKFNLEAGLSYFLLDNHIYFTDKFVPEQRNGAINIVQFYMQKHFNWKILSLENLVVVQSSTDNDIINFPSFWSKHSLFVQRKIFKRVMLARLGLDLRLSNSYFANNFNPGLGQFFVQSEREVELYPAVDVHFGFVVEKFRIFFKLENITALVTDDIFYQIPFYPQKEIAFRFGISWRFLDKNSNKKGSVNGQGNTSNTSRPQSTRPR